MKNYILERKNVVLKNVLTPVENVVLKSHKIAIPQKIKYICLVREHNSSLLEVIRI